LQRQVSPSSNRQPTSVKKVRELSSASSSFTRQHRPHPSQTLYHSDFVIFSNGLRFQNGISSWAMVVAFRGEILWTVPAPGVSLHLVTIAP